jgi:DIS3-like exonuclease 2
MQKTGRVVFILEEKHTRKAAGNLKLFGDKNPKFALFSPTDSTVPRMKIPMEECPSGFLQRADEFKDTLFVAKITKWEQVANALGKNTLLSAGYQCLILTCYCKIHKVTITFVMLGNLLETLGDARDIEVRSRAILLTHDIDDSEFPAEVLACLPEMPFVISEDEIKKRRDFRNDCVFTIDPSTAR